jgi:hypothetical protein
MAPKRNQAVSSANPPKAVSKGTTFSDEPGERVRQRLRDPGDDHERGDGERVLHLRVEFERREPEGEGDDDEEYATDESTPGGLGARACPRGVVALLGDLLRQPLRLRRHRLMLDRGTHASFPRNLSCSPVITSG